MSCFGAKSLVHCQCAAPPVKGPFQHDASMSGMKSQAHIMLSLVVAVVRSNLHAESHSWACSLSGTKQGRL